MSATKLSYNSTSLSEDVLLLNAQGLYQSRYAFDLMQYCLRGDCETEVLVELIHRIDRWDLFLKMVDWHRVAPLVLMSLSLLESHLPDVIFTELKQRSRTIAVSAFRHLSELKRISLLLEENDIQFLVLKGLPLSMQLHGDIGRRASKDIDILVRDGDVEKTHEIMLRLGYHRIMPCEAFALRAMQYYKEFCKDFVYWHREFGVEVEVHWRLEENPYFLPINSFQPFHNRQLCCLGNMRVQVLSLERNVLYLAVHAAHSSWARISWLVDIAILLRSSSVDWREVVELSKKLDLMDVVWVSVLAANRLLGAPVPEVFFCDEYKPSITSGLLLKAVLKLSRKGCYPNGITLRSLQFLYMRNWNFVWFNIIHTMVFSLNDIALLPLSKRWIFLYLPLRPILWMWRRTISKTRYLVGILPGQ